MKLELHFCEIVKISWMRTKVVQGVEIMSNSLYLMCQADMSLAQGNGILWSRNMGNALTSKKEHKKVSTTHQCTRQFSYRIKKMRLDTSKSNNWTNGLLFRIFNLTPYKKHFRIKLPIWAGALNSFCLCTHTCMFWLKYRGRCELNYPVGTSKMMDSSAKKEPLRLP